MEYVYAALALHEADTEITEDTLQRTLEAAGVTVEQSRVRALNAALEDVDLQDAVDGAAGGPTDQPEVADEQSRRHTSTDYDMGYVYAALLLDEVGTEITEATLRRTLEAIDATIEQSRIEALAAALQDVDVQDAIDDAATNLDHSEVTEEQSDVREPAEEPTEQSGDTRVDSLDSDSTEAIEEFLAADASDDAIHSDLTALQQYIGYNKSIDLQTDAARAVRKHYETVRNDPQLDPRDKSEVIERLLDRLEEGRQHLEDQFRDDALVRVWRELGARSPRDSGLENRLQSYQWYSKLEAVLSGAVDSPSDKSLRSFQREWENIEESLPDDTAEDVRETVQEELRERQDALKNASEGEIATVCTESIEAIIEQNEDTEQALTDIRTLRKALDGPTSVSFTSSTPAEVRKLKNIFEIIGDSPDDELYEVAAGTLSEGLADTYKLVIEEKADNYLRDTQDPNTVQWFVKTIREMNRSGTAHTEVGGYDSTGVQALKTVAAVRSDGYLLDEDKDRVHSWVENRVETVIREREEYYEERISDVLSQIERRSGTARNGGETDTDYEQIYSELDSTLDNPVGTEESDFPEVRQFRRTWQEVLDDELLSDGWRRAQKRNIRTEIGTQQERTAGDRQSAVSTVLTNWYKIIVPIGIVLIGLLVFIL